MEKELADALHKFHQELLKPELDATDGKLADQGERLTEVCSRLKDLSKLLGRLEESLSAASLTGMAQDGELDPEIRAMLEKND